MFEGIGGNEVGRSFGLGGKGLREELSFLLPGQVSLWGPLPCEVEQPRQQVLQMYRAKVADPRRYNKPSSRGVAVDFVNTYPRRTITNGDGAVAGDVQRLS